MGSSPCLPQKICVIWKWEVVKQRQGPGWSTHVHGRDLSGNWRNKLQRWDLWDVRSLAREALFLVKARGDHCNWSWKKHWKFPLKPRVLWVVVKDSLLRLHRLMILWPLNFCDRKWWSQRILDPSSVLDLICRWQVMDCSAYKDFVGQLYVRQVGIFSYLWSSLLFVSDFSFPFAWSNFLGRTTWSCF